MSSPHDRLFKAVFGEPRHAAAHLSRFLPARVVEAIDLAALSVVPGSFVDDRLRAAYTDLLFTAPFRAAEGEALVYLLFEHQSSSDPLMAWRMLRYMMRIWEQLLEGDGELVRLPPIVPVVLHHSETGWRAPVRFEALLAGPAEAVAALAPHVPQLELVVTDLSAVPDEALWRGSLESVVLLLFEHIRAGDLPERLTSWRELLQAVAQDSSTGLRALARVVEYVLQTAGLPIPVLQQATREVHVDMAQLIETTADRLRAEGELIGEARARAEMVVRLLEARGVSLPVATRERILACRDREELERWFDRALVARVAAELFAPDDE